MPPTAAPLSATPLSRLSTSAAASPSGTSTVDSAEVRKFTELSGLWWRFDGPFAGLHQMNSVRVPLVRRAASAVLDARCATQPRDGSAIRALHDVKIVDIGCGGGILSEALARLGAHVTGVDAAAANIKAADAHRSLDPSLFARLNYANTTAEALAADGHRYDVVVASEVIEHVSNVGAFLDAATALMKVRQTVAAAAAADPACSLGYRLHSPTCTCAGYLSVSPCSPTARWSSPL